VSEQGEGLEPRMTRMNTEFNAKAPSRGKAECLTAWAKEALHDQGERGEAKQNGRDWEKRLVKVAHAPLAVLRGFTRCEEQANGQQNVQIQQTPSTKGRPFFHGDESENHVGQKQGKEEQYHKAAYGFVKRGASSDAGVVESMVERGSGRRSRWIIKPAKAPSSPMARTPAVHGIHSGALRPAGNRMTTAKQGSASGSSHGARKSNDVLYETAKARPSRSPTRAPMARHLRAEPFMISRIPPNARCV